MLPFGSGARPALIPSVNGMFRTRAAVALALIPGLLTIPRPAPADVLPDSAAVQRLVRQFAGRQGYPGIAVAIVKDDRIVLTTGAGHDSTGAPVTATTPMPVASVSKSFTALAVMQLVEAGKLDLDADINRYLDFKVPPYDGKPMTMRQLMTHSAGFADTSKDLFPPDLKSLKPLSRMAEVPMPARIFPPGTTPAYSNYGASLAGYIVQRVSGQPFDDYIEQHIFAPLGMAHSTFRQPLPQGWSANMSKGYRTASGRPGPFELVQMPPAGPCRRPARTSADS